MGAPVGNTNGLNSNPQNRNQLGIRGKRGFRSELRKLANKLKEREELALEIIDKALKGEAVDKDVLSTGKWIIERVVSVTAAAVNEEQRKLAMKKAVEETEEQQEDNSVGEVEKPVRFSLHMLPKKD